MSFPSDYNFKYYVGDTKSFVLHPKNKDGTAYDLNGFTASMTISTELKTNPDWSIDAETVLNATDGYIECTITPDIGIQLTASKYYYDIEIRKTVSGKEVVYTLLKGIITPEMGVNKHV